MNDLPRLSLDRIGCVFGTVTAVDEVSLSVASGEMVCLLGPSGCGKTTTLRIAAGVEHQTTGSVTIDGRVVSNGASHIPPEQRSIGLMFQDFALFPHLTVADNIGFGLTRGTPNRAGVVADYLTRVGLDHYGPKYPHMLSGGEQQRVALARALAPKPRVMLMDEPFSGLDNRLRDAVRDETLAILDGEETGVLLVTHDPGEAMRMADRIALMRDGRIVQTGTPHDLFHAPIDREAAAFFSDVNVLAGQVQDGAVDTPFGRIPAQGFADGATAEVVIRPQHVMVSTSDPGPGGDALARAEATLERARFIGAGSLIEARLGPDGPIISALVPNAFVPAKGADLWLSVPRARCFVFKSAG
ncbi:MAG: ABC transporter ATP-binding protein [Pseudomonadota bacterium]